MDFGRWLCFVAPRGLANWADDRSDLVEVEGVGLFLLASGDRTAPEESIHIDADIGISLIAYQPGGAAEEAIR